MTEISRRTILTGVAAAAAATVPGVAGAVTTYMIRNSSGTDWFSFTANSIPRGGYMKITWTRNGTAQYTTTTQRSWSSGTQVGYSNAQATLYYSNGVVAARSAIIAGSTTTPTPSTGTPAAAIAAGMTNLTLATDFTSTSSIDVNHTGAAGYQWYTHNAFGQTQSASSFRSNGSYLTIDPDISNCNWSISTGDARTGQGRVFQYGYFEATFRFVPRTGASLAADGTACWPSFWLISADNAMNTGPAPWGELDIFEALADTTRGQWAGAIHQWPDYNATPDAHHWSVGLYPYTNADMSQFHKYALLVLPPDPTTGNTKGQWFFDDRLVTEWNWGGWDGTYGGPGGTWGGRILCDGHDALDAHDPIPNGLFACNSTNKFALALGTGKGWPMDVKNVRVWTR